MESRELFWSLDSNSIFLFYVFGYASIAVFLWGCWQHFNKYRHALTTVIPVNVITGIKKMLLDVLTHRSVRRRDTYAGLAHSGLFFGFVIAAIGTAIITLEYDILKPLFGVQFWKGDFYLWYSLILDLGHLALVIGILMMMARRLLFSLPKLTYLRAYAGEVKLRDQAKGWRLEDWAFLIVLLLIEISGFLQEAVRFVMEQPDWASWSPVGFYFSKVLITAGMDVEQAMAIRSANWWMHGILALAFTAAIPWYKTKHILAVLGSLSVKDSKALRRLPKIDSESTSVGINAISDLSWKDMLNLDACTKCGRCQEACPATASSYPLSPRDIILDLRIENDKKPEEKANTDLAGNLIASETLWACRTCGACQEICPVGIEHPTMIVQMRRQLVERGDMDPLLQKTLTTIGDTGNSFGRNNRERAAWTRELNFRIKDIRDEEAEVLWFVGDYASFDPRCQEISRIVARLLKAAGVDFALLHEGERTAGNDVRRTGEEGLYESLVEHNLEQMTGCKSFSRIMTTDPHSFNTLKNEYPEFGEIAPVEHYSSILSELLTTGRLQVVNPLNKHVTFHDPCHLGRLNNCYEAPREVIRLTGCEVVEMPRNRDNSFCCGAGGGRIWIPDDPGTQKPSESRMHEAAALSNIDYFITSCPKDLTMYEDARKTSGHEEDFLVKDIAELVAESISLEKLAIDDMPAVIDKLANTIALKVSDAVVNRVDEVIAARLKQNPQLQGSAESVEKTEPEKVDKPVDHIPETDVERAAAMSTDVIVETVEDNPVAEPVSDRDVQLEPMDWDNLKPAQPAVFDDYPEYDKAGIRILVAVKHGAVLGDEYEFTADNRDVGSEYLNYELSDWDDAALEEALLIKDRLENVEVVAVTVGPEAAEDTLLKVLAKGADRAVRVWHDCLTSADPVYVAQALSGVAARENPELILTGAQSGDFSHGATGIAMSRILGMPHIAIVIEVDWQGEKGIRLVRELEGGVLHTLEMTTPALLTIQTGSNTPRFATMRMIKKAKKKPLDIITAGSMQEQGGASVIRRMYTPELGKAEMLEGSAEDIADAILGIIKDKRGE